jgi:hypothetical protein
MMKIQSGKSDEKSCDIFNKQYRRESPLSLPGSIQFCRQARGSLAELIDDLNICLDDIICRSGQ